jgi:hypothetical protein
VLGCAALLGLRPLFRLHPRFSRWSLFLLPLLTACGIKQGDDEEPKASSKPAPRNCESFSACGGDLVGRWVLRASCVGNVPSDPACVGYASNQSVSGTAIYDFGSDDILRYEGSVHVEYDISASEACTQATAHKDPIAFCKLVESSSHDNPRIPASISCDATDAVCSCHVDQGPIGGGSDSSYAVSGTSLTILADGAATTLGYCVGAGTLTLGSLTGEPASIFDRQ